ncbi:hypothetical protein FB45DRAFT_891113, partial [Roridomyces roridus]
MSKTVKDLTAGTAGGIAQVLVGQPFDIVKVRMQTAPQGTYSGTLCDGYLEKPGVSLFTRAPLRICWELACACPFNSARSNQALLCCSKSCKRLWRGEWRDAEWISAIHCGCRGCTDSGKGQLWELLRSMSVDIIYGDIELRYRSSSIRSLPLLNSQGWDIFAGKYTISLESRFRRVGRSRLRTVSGLRRRKPQVGKHELEGCPWSV